jgi:membrane-associated phospholipid phosphatase
MQQKIRFVSDLKNQRLLIAGVVALFFFILVAALVVSRVTQSIDSSLALKLNMGLGSEFTTLMLIVSNYGREYFWTGVVALMLIFGKKQMKIFALELAVLLIAGALIGEGLKLLISRNRPYEDLSRIVLRAPADTDSSFPSGHALIVSIGAVFALTKFKKKIVAVLLTIEAVVVCYSRVYLGLHYPMDILGGVFAGATIVFIGLLVLENYFPKGIDLAGRWFQKCFELLHIPELF